VDPTGAGDVFASGFLIEYHLARDPWRAAAFACCAASFAVERPGLEGIPDRESVERRLALYRGGSGR
jgi:1D-myo-inositol 3-kinase